MEENLGTASERLHVSCVRREGLDDFFCHSVFSANVCERANHFMGSVFSTFKEVTSMCSCLEALNKFTDGYAIVKGRGIAYLANCERKL